MSIIDTLKILISPLPDAEKAPAKPKLVSPKPSTPAAPVQCDKKTLPPEQPKPTPPKCTYPTQTLTPYELGLLWGRIHSGVYKRRYLGDLSYDTCYKGSPFIDKSKCTIEQEKLEGLVVGETATYYKKIPTQETYKTDTSLNKNSDVGSILKEIRGRSKFVYSYKYENKTYMYEARDGAYYEEYDGYAEHFDGIHAYLWRNEYPDRITVTWHVRDESLPQPIRDKVLKRRLEAFSEAFSKAHVKTKPLTEEEKAQAEKDNREMFIFKIVFFAMLLFVALCVLIAYLK